MNKKTALDEIAAAFDRAWPEAAEIARSRMTRDEAYQQGFERGYRAGCAAERDRVERDMAELENLRAEVEGLREMSGRGATVCATDDTNETSPEGQLQRGIKDLFAQYERAVIRARTKAALAVKKSRGERVGTVPYGYRLLEDGKQIEPEPDEQKVIAKVLKLRRRGLTQKAVAEKLNKEGVPARGSRWHTTTIARLERREHASQRRPHNAETATGGVRG